MLFNSIEFAIFLPIVFICYWLIPQRYINLKNLVLILSSYIFYGMWDWRFLGLIILSSAVDYSIGLLIGQTTNEAHRKYYLWLSLFVNLGLLGFFKYFNFFIENFENLFFLLGRPIQISFALKILLPVGISFYTFQTLSYTIDVYRRKIEPTKNIISFFAFVSFFPQLVAGPIERATNLLPQFSKSNKVNPNEIVDSLRQILWGLFKKIVVADSCAPLVEQIFSNYTDFSSSTLLLGAVLFSFQIYGDFSGYSDIAIGVAKLFGITLSKNFATPYFSRDVPEFWRRWHISLSSWFKNYLYIPLGGNQLGKGRTILNVFIVFLVSGFWHGANWTFIAWGGLNAIYMLPALVLGNTRKFDSDVVAATNQLPSIFELLRILWTYLLITVSWVFFRAESIGEGFNYLTILFSFSTPLNLNILPSNTVWIGIILTIIIEWSQRNHNHGLDLKTNSLYRIPRWVLYSLLIILILGQQNEPQAFIYFQF